MPGLAAIAVVALAGCGGTSSTPDTGVVDVPRDTAVDVPVDTGPPRCRSNTECAGNPAGTVCDTTTGACVGCLTSPADTCMPSQHCDPVSRRCAAGCSRDEGCTEGTARRCDTLVNACVECVTSDHCMAGQLCRGGRCAAGCSAERACPTGQACCTGACVDTQTNVADCGGCGMTCRAPNGVPGCAAGACTIAMCTAPYADCDMTAANGCEANTQVSAAHCGACGTACPTPANGTATCRAGACAIACNMGFGDCDGMAANGCEADLRATAEHCGACGRACAPSNATGACMDGACRVGACSAGFGDCDMDAANGCETSTAANVTHCGRCGNACTAPANARASCAGGACGFVCNPGFGDCDGMASNGCETDTAASATHCGACGMACGGTCAGGVCMGLTCPTGRGDCDGMAANGCETDTTTTAAHCGACRRACAAGPNATAACAAGACGVTCTTGYGDCDTNPVNGCEIETRVSTSHCGACGRACASGEVCQDGVCVAPCPGAQVRCGGTCVSTETSNLHCGRCGNACPTGSTCAGATCRCPLGADPVGGVQCGATCVDVSTSNTNCGACGNVCPTGSTCTRGNCRCPISGVPVGVVCGSACVNPFEDVRHCGRCDNACPSGQVCTTGVCRCPEDAVTCDGRCTSVRTDRENCGACGRVCPSGQACAGGTCFDPSALVFRVTSFTATACNGIEHEPPTGDDRGGIAVSTTRVFYTGDRSTAHFSLTDLGGGTAVGRVYDGIVGNLANGQVYTLATNATTPVPSGGGTITHLIEINGSTGALTSTAIALSRSINMPGNAGIFSGFNRIVLHDTARVYSILLPAGTVIDHGAMANPSHQGCENWAYWGFAEFFGGNLYIDYVQNNTTVARTRVPDGTTTALATFSSLSDMCSITVSPSAARWYWHHEGGSQFRSGDESVGYCNAAFSTSEP